MALPSHGGPYHAVQFYATDEGGYSTASAFLAEGLVAGEPAMIIASAAHREGLLGQLSARFIHVEHARRNGALLVLDADEMLERFMVDGLPDPERFDTTIGRFIDQVLQGRPRSVLRAYGGMVDILVATGTHRRRDPARGPLEQAGHSVRPGAALRLRDGQPL